MSSTKFEARLAFQDGRLVVDAGTRTSTIIYQLGFWSAAILTALCALELLAQIPLFITMGSGAMETNPAYYFAQLPALLTGPLFVVLMACLYPVVAGDNKVFALIALAFAVCYAVLGGINYYVQLTAVRLAMFGAPTDAMAPFFMPNLSVMFSFDIFGYFFLTLSALAAAPLFKGAGLERWIRWVLVINFGIGIAALVGNFIGNPMLLLPVLPATWTAAGAATGLLAVWFRRSYPIIMI